MTAPGTGPATTHTSPVAWLFLAAQAGLEAAVVFLPGPDPPPASAFRVSGLVVAAVGLAVILLSAVQLGVSFNVLPTPNRGGELRTAGLYRLVRHPMYLGVLLVAGGAVVWGPTLARIVAAVGLGILLREKSAWEERRLIDRFPDYLSYAAHTPAFVPFLLSR